MVSSEICAWPNACWCIPYLSPCMATNMNHTHLRFTQVDHSPTSKKKLTVHYPQSWGSYKFGQNLTVDTSPSDPRRFAQSQTRIGRLRPPPRIYSHEISQLVGWFPLRSIIPVTPDWSRYLFHPDVWAFILRKLLRQWDITSEVSDW